MDLKQIELLAAAYATAHANTRALVESLERQLQAVKADFMPELRKSVAAAKQRKARLQEAVGISPEQFEAPRTQILHGIKVGFRKQKGGLSWDDADKVVERIERIYAAAAPDYLHVAKKPDKEALTKLTVCELRKLGVEVLSDSDKVVVEPTSGDVDKIVAALLKDAPETEA